MNSTQPTSRGTSSISTPADVREAWVLRAGAELWKAVVQEDGHLATDTQKALEAVRDALDCARCLRRAEAATDLEQEALSQEAAAAWSRQLRALQEWGRGRGLNWENDWGTQWGESLHSAECSSKTPALG